MSQDLYLNIHVKRHPWHLETAVHGVVQEAKEDYKQGLCTYWPWLSVLGAVINVIPCRGLYRCQGTYKFKGGKAIYIIIEFKQTQRKLFGN